MDVLAGLRADVAPQVESDPLIDFQLTQFHVSSLRALGEVIWQLSQAPACGWYVLVGDNGSGKTTVLRSIALALMSQRESDALGEPWSRCVSKDVHPEGGWTSLLPAGSQQVELEDLGEMALPAQKNRPAAARTVVQTHLARHGQGSRNTAGRRGRVPDQREEEVKRRRYDDLRRHGRTTCTPAARATDRRTTTSRCSLPTARPSTSPADATHPTRAATIRWTPSGWIR